MDERRHKLSRDDYPSLALLIGRVMALVLVRVTESLGVQTFEKVLDGVCDLGRQSHGG